MHSTIKHITPIGNYDVPTGWPMKSYKRPYGGTSGPPVMYEKPSDPEEEGAGYGYSNGMSQQERDVFFYHSDHLGSSSFITNTEGEVVQHIEYVPYGEVFIEERNNVWNTPYLFNAKEFDEETGLYYYGARYYDSRLAIWYGVDALAEKYPSMGGYVYCAGNPISITDPDGNDIKIVGNNESCATLTTDLIDFEVNASALGIDWGGQYTLEGEDVLSAGLDIVGIFDSTGVADGVNAALQAKNGDYLGATISAVGLIPYVGDVAKVGKVGKDVKIIGNAIGTVKSPGKKAISSERRKAVRQAWKDERSMVENTNNGTRDWTRAEKQELLERGRVKGYEGHHINSVNGHP